MHLLVSWLVVAFGLWLTSAVVPGFRINGFKGALVVAAVFGLIHFFIGWFIFVMLGLGTFFLGFVFAFVTWWIVTAIVLKITDAFSDNLEIDGFKTALVASAVLSVLSALKTYLLR